MKTRGTDLPKVTICVPICNVELFIGRCVESLMQQTYDNLEFIFVNDCTPDKSMEVLLEILNHYPQRKNQVRIINLPQNKGIAFARNLAIDTATSEYIAYVDSDDWIEKDAIEVLVTKQQKNNADLVFGNCSVHYPNGEIKEGRENLFSKTDPLEYILKNTHNYHIWGHLIKKELYTKNNVKCKIGVNVGEDMQTLPRLCYFAKNYVTIDRVIYHYNKCNPHSCGQGKKDFSWFKHLVESYDIFYDFFNKLGITKYTEILHQSKNDFLYRSMRVAVIERCKDAYQLIKSELIKHETLYPKYKFLDLRHILKKNYSIYYLFLKCFRS